MERTKIWTDLEVGGKIITVNRIDFHQCVTCGRPAFNQLLASLGVHRDERTDIIAMDLKVTAVGFVKKE